MENKLHNKELAELANMGDNEQHSDLKSYFECLPTGLYYHGVGVDKHGITFPKPPVRISDPFRIVGRGQSEDEREYRIIEYQRNGRGVKKLAAFPMGLVSRNDGLSYFRENLSICIKDRYKSELWDYVQWDGERTEWQITSRGGWCDESCTAYVLPNGEVIGHAANKVMYTGDNSRKAAYAVSGSLKEWQDEIARYARGNSRLLLALGVVFAAPLLGVLREESGGFHFFGSSSIGKSIAGMVAVSAIGEPTGLKVQWKGTSLGFDNHAAANNDSIVFLDEIGEADQKTVKDVAYSIFNGVSKLQGAKQGGNRVQQTWRVLAISNGEYDAEHYLKQDGLEWNAGQAVRLPAIPADVGKGFGSFDTLHDFDSSVALAMHLESSAKRIYGSAFRAYLRELTQNMQQQPEKTIARINQLRAEFGATLPPNMDSQPKRVAKRFILVAAALELASEWGITGFEKGIGMAGVRACFMDWYARDGKGNREENQILRNAINFMQEHGHGERLYLIDRGSYPVEPATGRNHAGYRLKHSERIYINDTVFQQEICKGFDEKFVCKVLRDCGWLVSESPQRNKMKITKEMSNLLSLSENTRMYCLQGFQPPETAEPA